MNVDRYNHNRLGVNAFNIMLCINVTEILNIKAKLC